jgi:serine/threonine-protein kinase HipA
MADVGVDELRFVGAAEVVKRGRVAARLVRESGAVRFQYESDYLDDPDAPAVATTLPRTPEPTVTPAGAVPPFFAGLLPEGRRLGALQRAVKTSADDELSLLLAIGQDTIGDVEVVPVGYRAAPTRAAVEVDAWADVAFADIYHDVTGERLVRPRAGLAGVQPKVSTEIVSLPVKRAGEQFILKLDPPDLPHLVANEAFFLAAARASGLDAARAEIVTDRDGTTGLLVRRFDRVVVDGKVVALAQEDACQVLGRYPADKYTVTTEAMVDALSRTSGAPIVAARSLVRQVAFAYLTANGDAHAKNFSIAQGLDGEWRITPAYDVPSSHPYGDHTMALTIGGKLDERIGRADFLTLGERVGVAARATARMLDDLVARVDLWLPTLDELPFDTRALHKLRRAIDYRRGRLSRA